MFYCIIILLLIMVISGAISFFTFDDHFIISCMGLVISFIFLILCLSCGLSRINYNVWATQFEVQKEIIAQTNLNEYTIVEIIDANKELAQYQALYKTFGNFGPIPKEVMDIEPIKIGN